MEDCLAYSGAGAIIASFGARGSKRNFKNFACDALGKKIALDYRTYDSYQDSRGAQMTKLSKRFLFIVAYFAFLLCIFFLDRLITPAVIAKEATDEAQKSSKYEPISWDRYEVIFSGLSEPVRVFPLSRARKDEADFGKTALPEDILRKIAKARDKNARWLVLERRKAMESLSFTLEVTYPTGKSVTYPYTGRYTRGIILTPPSEFMLYYCDPRNFSYREDDKYFYIVRKGYKGKGDGVLPVYILAGGLTPTVLPPSWLTLRDVLWFGIRENFEIHPEHELWFAKDDLRLVREVSTYSVDGQLISGRVEANYYYHDSEFPTILTIKSWQKGHPELAQFTLLYFQVVKGFWLLSEGVIGAPTSGELESLDWRINKAQPSL